MPAGDADFETDTGGAEGVGDLSVLARYTFFEHHSLAATTLLAASAGLKLPTGDTLGRNDVGNFMDAHTQLGTGSTDVFLGLSASHAVGRLNLSANVLAAVTTEGDAGHVAHQFGDSLNYDLTGKYRLFPEMPGDSPLQCFVSLGVNGEWRSKVDPMTDAFHDHFSSVARSYAEGRPSYPPALFDWLASLCATRDCVWDGATGSGQAAVDLARYFRQVIATDASAKQLA